MTSGEGRTALLLTCANGRECMGCAPCAKCGVVENRRCYDAARGYAAARRSFMPDRLTLAGERNVPVSMRDGVVLYADMYRPGGPGPYPTLLQRTPYDKGGAIAIPIILRAVSSGYAVVVQDVRGRFESDGDFYAFVNERQDGYDTLEWLVAQPWCDGNVGMFGQSYVGLTQWQAAMSGHPALKAIVPTVTAADY